MRQQIQRKTPIVIEKSQHFCYKFALHVDIPIIPHETVKSKLDANSISYGKKSTVRDDFAFLQASETFLHKRTSN